MQEQWFAEMTSQKMREARADDYNNGRWHGWNGGECPVHPKSVVLFIFPDESFSYLAGITDWSSPCLFKVVEPYTEPTIAAIEAQPAPDVAKLVEAVSMARRRLETIADEAWIGDARDFKRRIPSVFSEWDEALAALEEKK